MVSGVPSFLPVNLPSSCGNLESSSCICEHEILSLLWGMCYLPLCTCVHVFVHLNVVHVQC